MIGVMGVLLMILYNFRHVIRKLTAQQQNYEFNIAQPVSETHAFRHHPNVVSESNCEALKAALLHQDRVAVKNKGKILSNSRSLQAIGDTCNSYKKAISIIGKTLAPFDEDNLIPCFGFGDATTYDQKVISFHNNHSPCHRFEDFLDCHRRMDPNMKFSDYMKAMNQGNEKSLKASILIDSNLNWFFEESEKTKWSLEENKMIGSAIAFFDKDTPDRWFKVACRIPGKNVSDVIKYSELEVGVSDIEAGLIPVTSYTHDSFSLYWMNNQSFNGIKHIRVPEGKCSTLTQPSDQEREKGVAWTEEHRFLEGKIREDQASTEVPIFIVLLKENSSICTKETSKGKKPEKGISYEIFGEHFGELLADAAESFHDVNRINVKGNYKGTAIRFELRESSMIELEDMVIERLKLKTHTFSIKYQEDEGDWVLIACRSL